MIVDAFNLILGDIFVNVVHADRLKDLMLNVDIFSVMVGGWYGFW